MILHEMIHHENEWHSFSEEKNHPNKFVLHQTELHINYRIIKER